MQEVLSCRNPQWIRQMVCNALKGLQAQALGANLSHPSPFFRMFIRGVVGNQIYQV